MEKPFMQEHVGKGSPRLGSKRRNGSRHHDPFHPLFVHLSIATERQEYTCNQQYKKGNQIDSQQLV